MPVVYCKVCGRKNNGPTAAIGKHGKCKQCQSLVLIPDQDEEPPPTENPSLEIVPAVAMQIDEDENERGKYKSASPDNVPLLATVPGSPVSSLGIASIILGILGFFICWIPFVNLLSLPLCGVGLVLGFFSLFMARKHSGGIGFPIGGLVVSGLGFLIALSMNLFFGAAISRIGKTSASGAQPNTNVSGNTEAIRSSTETATPATSTAKLGDVEVCIERVAVERVKLKDVLGDAESKETLLTIRIGITNRNKSKKPSYTTWDPEFARDDSAILRDNFDNSYKRVFFSAMTQVIGHVRSETLYPNKTIKDILVFETPLETVGFMMLKLPAKNFGGEGEIIFKIEGVMIEGLKSK